MSLKANSGQFTDTCLEVVTHVSVYKPSRRVMMSSASERNAWIIKSRHACIIYKESTRLTNNNDIPNYGHLKKLSHAVASTWDLMVSLCDCLEVFFLYQFYNHCKVQEFGCDDDCPRGRNNYKGSQYLQNIPKTSRLSQRSPKSSKRLPDVPKKWKKLPGRSQRLQKIQKPSRRSHKVPDAPRGPQKLSEMMPELPDASNKFPNGTTASQKLPDAPKGSQKIPQAPKRSQNAPRSFQKLLETSIMLPETPGNSPKSPETASHGVALLDTRHPGPCWILLLLRLLLLLLLLLRITL